MESNKQHILHCINLLRSTAEANTTLAIQLAHQQFKWSPREIAARLITPLFFETVGKQSFLDTSMGKIYVHKHRVFSLNAVKQHLLITQDALTGRWTFVIWINNLKTHYSLDQLEQVHRAQSARERKYYFELFVRYVLFGENYPTQEDVNALSVLSGNNRSMNINNTVVLDSVKHLLTLTSLDRVIDKCIIPPTWSSITSHASQKTFYAVGRWNLSIDKSTIMSNRQWHLSIYRDDSTDCQKVESVIVSCKSSYQRQYRLMLRKLFKLALK